jgi:hypothetical protein
MVDITDFQIGQGESFKAYIQLLNQSNSNSPVDITDYTFQGQIRENYTTDEIAAEFSFEKVSPNTSGSLYITLSPEVTSTLTQRSYVYDIKFSSGSLAPVSRRLLEGSLTVRPAVTR